VSASDPQTWSALKTTLANWLNRTDLTTTEIPEAISLAERRLNRIIRAPEMEDSVTTTTSSATFTLPTDFLEMRSIYIDRDPINYLQEVSMAELRGMFPTTDTDVPTHYALQSGNEIVVRPLPSGSFSYILNYYAKIPSLDGTQTTNWLLTSHSDIYVYASLAELFVLTRDNDGWAMAEARLQSRLAELNGQSKRKAWSSAPIAPARSTTNVPNIRA
jgi:hypothetical protein